MSSSGYGATTVSGWRVGRPATTADRTGLRVGHARGRFPRRAAMGWLAPAPSPPATAARPAAAGTATRLNGPLRPADQAKLVIRPEIRQATISGKSVKSGKSVVRAAGTAEETSTAGNAGNRYPAREYVIHDGRSVCEILVLHLLGLHIPTNRGTLFRSNWIDNQPGQCGCFKLRERNGESPVAR